jgi:Ca2+-binding RTX toxin-like protein
MTRIRQALTMTGLHPVPRQRRIVAALGAAVSAWLLSVGATPAPAQGVLDANCPGPSGGTFQTVGDGRMAQTFTAQRTGSLVRGEFEINKAGSPGGDWVMQIVATDDSGAPVNILLASATPIADATVPAGASRIAGVFASPLSVEAGNRYALVLTRPGAQQVAVQTAFDNPCPGQQFFSMSPGGSWEAFSPNEDSVFAVFVEPPPSGPGVPGVPGVPGATPPTCKGKPATIIGTSSNDVRSGTPGRDVMVGLAGNDRLSGLVGKDLICGGTGKDALKGGGKNDKLAGAGGKDRLSGGGGADRLKGGGGKDRFNCGGGTDKVTAQEKDKVSASCEKVVEKG